MKIFQYNSTTVEYISGRKSCYFKVTQNMWFGNKNVSYFDTYESLPKQIKRDMKNHC